MMIGVSEICGLRGVPTSRIGVHKWLKSRNIPLSKGVGRFIFRLSDLPEDVRRAYLDRQAEEAGLEVGEYDDAAHTALMRRPLAAQARAQENAAMLMFCAKRAQLGMTWEKIEQAGKAAFGKGFPTRNTWKTWTRKTEGVDPANWAPALAPNWTCGNVAQQEDPEAWAAFVMRMQLGGKNGSGYPLAWAYRDVAELAGEKGWAWPSLRVIRHRWAQMDPVERLVAEVGEERAAALLKMTQVQHKRHLSAMDIADFDGRDFDLLIRFPDGYVGSPTVVMFTDRASGKIVGHAVGKSENADVTEAAILDMCETHYRPVAVEMDQGGAFNSQRIMGGQRPYFRKAQTRSVDWEVPGVLGILGIEGRNKGVGAKTSNLQENTWSSLRHVDQHPAFHKAQRSGPNDPDNTDPDPVPLDVFEAVLSDAVERLNRATDNRVKGLMKGESREQAFERLLKDGAKRVVTPLMRRRLGMVWKRKTVQPDGRLKFDGGMFGDDTTRFDMLPHAGKVVLVGFNPRDFNEPAMVCHWGDQRKRGRLILESLPCFAETAHGSDEGRRAAITEKRRIKELIKKARRDNPDVDVAELRAALMQRRDRRASPDRRDERVVELPTGGDFAAETPGREAPAVSYLTEERLRNLAEATARRQAARF